MTHGIPSLGPERSSSSRSSSSLASSRVSQRAPASRPAVATEPSKLNDDVSLVTRPATTIQSKARMRVSSLDAYFGSVHAVKGIDMQIQDRQVTAIIGPSGCGKSTFLRCLNRMHEPV